MELSDYKELLHSAREQFIKGNYSYAEPVLQQILLRNGALPEVYQMLATIYYDQGKFNKAIKTFQKALEVDPTYTDASVGLSIILNDLGRYDEAKNIFETAQSKLNQRKGGHDPLLDPKLAAKHADLASLYFRYQRYQEALEQYQKAYALSKN